jgi:hypothetical protein
MPPALSATPTTTRRALAVVEMIGATTTKAGLKVECVLDERTCQKGIKVSDAEMRALNITVVLHWYGGKYPRLLPN